MKGTHELRRFDPVWMREGLEGEWMPAVFAGWIGDDQPTVVCPRSGQLSVYEVVPMTDMDPPDNTPAKILKVERLAKEIIKTLEGA